MKIRVFKLSVLEATIKILTEFFDANPGLK